MTAIVATLGDPVFEPISESSGEHVCYTFLDLEYFAQTRFGLENSNSLYQIENAPHYTVVAELNPGANPC